LKIEDLQYRFSLSILFTIVALYSMLPEKNGHAE